MAKNPRLQQYDPIFPGISIGNLSEGTRGTIGAVVFDAQDQAYVLSCWHVLYGLYGGEDIVQPSPADLKPGMDSYSIGELQTTHIISEAGDYALCTIHNRTFKTDIWGIDKTPAKTAEAKVGDKVMKVGATTGITYGIIKATENITADVQAGPYSVFKVKGFRIEPDPEHMETGQLIADKGDSGSLWILQDDQPFATAVGLHFYGDANRNYAIACFIDPVLQKLEVSFQQNHPEEIV